MFLTNQLDIQLMDTDHGINPVVIWEAYLFDVNLKFFQKWKNKLFAWQTFTFHADVVCVCHQVVWWHGGPLTHCICRCLYCWLSQAASGAFYLDLRALLTSLHPHPLPMKQSLLMPGVNKELLDLNTSSSKRKWLRTSGKEMTFPKKVGLNQPAVTTPLLTFESYSKDSFQTRQMSYTLTFLISFVSFLLVYFSFWQ